MTPLSIIYSMVGYQQMWRRYSTSYQDFLEVIAWSYELFGEGYGLFPYRFMMLLVMLLSMIQS
jgi:hypothetical protein